MTTGIKLSVPVVLRKTIIMTIFHGIFLITVLDASSSPSSGQMWNHIRGPPFVHSSQSGGVAYIHGSSQAQFVLETYFVMGMYGLIVIGVVLLCEAGDEKNDPGVSK